MKIVRRVEFEQDPQAAKARQLQLARKLKLRPGVVSPALIGATDVAYDKETDRAYAAVVVLDGETFEVVERACWCGMPGYPYVPGLFALREASCLLEAFELVEAVPDVVMVDGHGTAHPRRFGLACLLGWSLDVPTVGCAKRVLTGTYKNLGAHAGAQASLSLDGEEIGRAVRTQHGTNPVFASPGYGYDMETAAELVVRTRGTFRIPEPLRQAHQYSIELRAAGEEVS
ncbi:MAG: endonuclease V [Myxococcota bacterium]